MYQNPVDENVIIFIRNCSILNPNHLPPPSARWQSLFRFASRAIAIGFQWFSLATSSSSSSLCYLSVLPALKFTRKRSLISFSSFVSLAARSSRFILFFQFRAIPAFGEGLDDRGRTTTRYGGNVSEGT